MDPVDNTQSPDAGPDAQTPPGQGQEGQNQPSPLTQRFSELTGTIKEQKDALAQQSQLIQQLMANQAALQQSIIQGQARPAEPSHFEVPLPEGIDPAQAQFFQNLTKGFQKQLEEANKRTEQAIQQAVGGVRQSQEQMEFSQAVASQPREVQELAGRLLQDWRRRGYTGWTPSDAITFARGQLGVPATTRRQAQNMDEPTVPGGSTPPDPRATRELPPPLPDEQLKRMSLRQQEEYWAKRVGDTQIVY